MFERIKNLSNSKVWAKEEDEKLISLISQKSVKEISSILNRSESAIYSRLKKINEVDSEGNKEEKKIKLNNERWSDEEEKILYFGRRDFIPYSLIANNIGRTESAVKKKYGSTNWSEKSYFVTKDKNIIAHHKRSISERLYEAQNSRLDLQKSRIDIVADRIVEAIDSLPKADIPKIYTPNNKGVKMSDPEDVGLMFSDHHIGHRHTKEETGGISEYNYDIFCERMENLKHAVARIYELHSKLYNLETLHIFCLGDIVAGMNNSGSWSPTFINLPIYEQFILGYKHIADFIYYCQGMFPKIKFYGIRGNHGRVAQKGYEKDNVNWDVLCYRFLEAYLQNNKNVEFVVPNTWWIMEEIRGHNFLMVHGDDIRSKNGLAVKGLEAFSEKMMGVTKKIPKYTLAGHFHTVHSCTTNLGKVLLNGSFVGADVYSLKDLHAFGRAEQTIFGIHDQRGITWKYNIDLDDGSDKHLYN